MKELVAIDLCCGAGGWACAARGLPIRIVLAVDMWDACCQTYKLNFPRTEVLEANVCDESVGERLAGLSGEVDIVLGAIPCEWVSHRRMACVNPVDDEERARERGTMNGVLDLVRLLDPEYWCIEDVKGLAKELPLEVPWHELHSEHFSAQRRKRIYIGSYPAPIFNRCDERMRDHLRPGPYRIGRRAIDRTICRTQTFTPDRIHGAYPDEKSPTICSFSSRRDAEMVIVDESLPRGRRQMEWQEAAALQGFPEDFVFHGSPTDVWKMIAQAIQIDTGRAILAEIVKHAQAFRTPKRKGKRVAHGKAAP